MIINNDIVKVTKKTEKAVNYETYDYFACTCKEKDAIFYEKIIDIFYPDANCGFYANKRSSYFIKELGKLGWSMESIAADMWMGAFFKKETENKVQLLDIKFDLFEFGLVAALIMAKNLEKENIN